MENIRLKFVSKIEMGQSPPSENYVSEGEGFPFLQGTADFGIKHPKPTVFCKEPSKFSNKNDILFSVRAPVGELNISDQAYGIGRGLCAISANSANLNDFIWWSLHHSRNQLRYVETGSTYAAVTIEDVKNIIIKNIPPDVQIKIAKYLDKEVSFIDYLIEVKKDLTNILLEKRQALISKIITKGINPNVTMKDSGVEWLDEIPRHWNVERTRWLFSERNERSETGEEEMLTVSHITGVTPRSEKNVNMFEAESTEGYKKCYKNDLVINTLWAWMGAMGIAPLEGIVSPAYHVYTPCALLLPEFIDAIVRMPIFASEVTRYSKGIWSSRLRLYPEGFYEVNFPVPPLIEQKEIVDYLRQETEQIDQLTITTERSIELLMERRAALISAAVTGQIEIPEEV